MKERLLKDWESLEGLILRDSYLHTLERFRRQLLNARECAMCSTTTWLSQVRQTVCCVSREVY